MKGFPKDFLWGASTSSHQVEGGMHNQWTEWEYLHAKKLAAGELKVPGWLPNIDQIKPQAANPDNYISGKGIEHRKHYKNDFDLLLEMNMNAYRFGIEWSRIEPKEGKWDEEAIEYYRDYIRELNKRGIEPIMTLFHWTMPVWFAKKGGFEKRSNLKYFERYVQKVAAEFAGDIKYVLTINEPNVYISFSYMLGMWPPQRTNPFLAFQVYWHLVLAHRRAHAIFKSHNPPVLVGIPAQVGYIRPLNPKSRWNLTVAAMVSHVLNWWFIYRIRKQTDFIGINYYFTEYCNKFGKMHNPERPISDLGWYMEPSGLYHVLVDAWEKFRKPILVTENGLADATDMYRKWWLQESIDAMQKALRKGVPLFGYLHWSLLDNFEWAYGWWPRFGLVHVDRKTMKRTIRPSAKWLAEQIIKDE